MVLRPFFRYGVVEILSATKSTNARTFGEYFIWPGVSYCHGIGHSIYFTNTEGRLGKLMNNEASVQ